MTQHAIVDLTANSGDQSLAVSLATAVQRAHDMSQRTQQSRDGWVGVSDMGHCREATRFVITRQWPTDNPSVWAASVGHAVGDYVEHAVQLAWPHAQTQVPVAVVLPSGIAVRGHVDVVLAAEDVVLDVKTKDGLDVIRKRGPSQQQQFQRHLYGLAAIQAGMVNERRLRVGNAYFDRSGRDPVPYVHTEPFRMDVVRAADDWYQEVLAAAKGGWRTHQDKPSEFCWAYCEFVTACRGDEQTTADDELPEIVDTEQLSAVDLYLQASDLERDAKRMKGNARRALRGVTGRTGTHSVRYTTVEPGEVPSYQRAGYDRLDIRALPTKP